MASTTRTQRIGIWIIAVVLAVGTIGSFFVIILANNNNAKDQASQQKLQDQYNKLMADYQAKVAAQTAQLSSQYYPVLSQYTGQVAKFDASSVKSLSTQDLLVGTGATIDSKTTYSAYYIGWTPDGKIFDESIDSGKLKAPIAGSGLIPGWSQGVVGMKLGGVRELSIPASLAYGSAGSGSAIAPNTPIKFVVLAIPSPPTIPVPNFSGATSTPTE